MGYYDPLIKPYIDGRHYYWSNFKIEDLTKDVIVRNNKGQTLKKKMQDRGIVVENFYNYKGDKRTIINNCVSPQAGLEIFNTAFKQQEQRLLSVSPTPQTSPKGDFSNEKEHNMGDKVTPSASPKDASHPSHHPNIRRNLNIIQI